MRFTWEQLGESNASRRLLLHLVFIYGHGIYVSFSVISDVPPSRVAGSAPRAGQTCSGLGQAAPGGSGEPSACRQEPAAALCAQGTQPAARPARAGPAVPGLGAAVFCTIPAGPQSAQGKGLSAGWVVLLWFRNVDSFS